MNMLRASETVLSIGPGIGSRLDDQNECAVPEAEHSIPEVGRVAHLHPIYAGQSPVPVYFLSYERKIAFFNEASNGNGIPRRCDWCRGHPEADATKFTCPNCTLNAWAKPDALIDCHRCSEEAPKAILLRPNELTRSTKPNRGQAHFAEAWDAKDKEICEIGP